MDQTSDFYSFLYGKSMRLARTLITIMVLLLFVSSDPLAAAQDNAQSAYDCGDFTNAFKMYLSKAKQGETDAQVRIGEMYYYGQGVERDKQQAEAWWTTAADHGNAEAAKSMGDIVYHESILGSNWFRAHGWWIRAAELFRERANRGDVKAEMLLGEMYMRGDGVEHDEERGMTWLLKAANERDCHAARMISFYNSTQEEESNVNLAHEWDHKAVEYCHEQAEHGDRYAAEALGFLYSTGRGGTVDKGAAYLWYKVAGFEGGALDEANAADIARIFKSEQKGVLDKRVEEWKDTHKLIVRGCN